MKLFYKGEIDDNINFQHFRGGQLHLLAWGAHARIWCEGHETRRRFRVPILRRCRGMKKRMGRARVSPVPTDYTRRTS